MDIKFAELIDSLSTRSSKHIAEGGPAYIYTAVHMRGDGDVIHIRLHEKKWSFSHFKNGQLVGESVYQDNVLLSRCGDAP
jgi:hypothetical protein